MTKKWLWLAIVAVAVGLAFLVSCAPQETPQERALRLGARADQREQPKKEQEKVQVLPPAPPTREGLAAPAAPSYSQQDWLEDFQETLAIVQKEKGLNCKVRADFDNEDLPILTVEMELPGRPLTRREAREMAEYVAGLFTGCFPNTKAVYISVEDWDSLREIYHGIYRGRQ